MGKTVSAKKISVTSSAARSVALGQAVCLALGLATGPALAETVNYGPGTVPGFKSRTTTVTTSTTTSTAATAGAPAATAAAGKATSSGTDLVALQGPVQIVHSGTGWKNNPVYVSLKKGQEILPMTMTFTNGANGNAKVSGLRVMLNGRKLADETYFRGSDRFSLNMSDLLTSGDTQMVVQTFGPAGSSVSWVLTTNKIKVSEIKPDTGAAGDKIVITGKNLPKQISAYQIFVGKQPATIKSVTATQIEFIVPTGLDGSKQTVTLYIAGVKCDPLFLKMKSAPEITGVNMIETTPASSITVYGKGFSVKASENQVFVGGTPLQVTSSTATQIEAFIPDSIQCPQRDIPVTVKTNGVDAKGSVTTCVTMRTIRSGESLPADGFH
jgi:hypothetical protein